MIYIAPMVINYLFLLIPARFFPKKLGAAITLIILGLLVILRGRVGTDTANVYEPMVAYLDQVRGTEPLFLLLLHALKHIFPTSLTVVTMGVGTTYIILLFIYLIRCNMEELFLFQAFYIPVLFYGSGISGQRSGIGLVAVLISLQCFQRKQYKWFTFLAIAGFFTHYSHAIFYLLWASIVINPKKKTHAISVIAGCISLGITAIAIQGYIESKYNLYFNTGFYRSSSLSGLSIISTLIIMMLGIILGGLPKKEKKRIVGIICSFLCIFWIVGYYSYGALRLIGFLQIVTPYAALTLYMKNAQSFGRNFKISIVLAGVLAFGFMYKDFINERNQGLEINSPALPYKFIWQETN